MFDMYGDSRNFFEYVGSRNDCKYDLLRVWIELSCCQCLYCLFICIFAYRERRNHTALRLMALSRVCTALLSAYRALLRVYKALLKVYRALLRVYRALSKVLQGFFEGL